MQLFIFRFSPPVLWKSLSEIKAPLLLLSTCVCDECPSVAYSIAKIADIGIALMILCAFCFVPAGFVIYLINERVHMERTQQSICGVGSVIYWCTALLWDMVSGACVSPNGVQLCSGIW